MDPNATYDDLSWELIVLALQGELSPEDELRFHQWLASSAANREHYEGLARIWKEGVADYPFYEQANETQGWVALRQKMEAGQAGWEEAGKAGLGEAAQAGRGEAGQEGREEARVIPVGAGKRVIGMARRMAVAAVLLLMAGAGWWYLSGRGSATAYETAANEEKNIPLPDGSTVQLQPRTRIEVAAGYNKTDRTVVLIEGKARFDVSRQKQQPFMVDMDAAQVKDIGTSFTIEKTKDSIEVAVSEGRIAFIPKKAGAPREISAGGVVCLYTPAHGLGEIRETGSAAGSADSLRFDNAPLSTVLSALEKVSGKKILLTDAQIAQKKLTIRLSGESLEDALRVICASFDLEYSVRNGVYILEKRKPSNHP
ncbi:MAG TPA: FecR domain-containing protein [Puia sp.]|nr:FecR domain-containing protein [Puia sp.]